MATYTEEEIQTFLTSRGLPVRLIERSIGLMNLEEIDCYLKYCILDGISNWENTEEGYDFWDHIDDVVFGIATLNINPDWYKCGN